MPSTRLSNRVCETRSWSLSRADPRNPGRQREQGTCSKRHTMAYHHLGVHTQGYCGTCAKWQSQWLTYKLSHRCLLSVSRTGMKHRSAYKFRLKTISTTSKWLLICVRYQSYIHRRRRLFLQSAAGDRFGFLILSSAILSTVRRMIV